MRGAFVKMDCIFCGIIEGQIPSEKVYEDDLCLAFKEIVPQAPMHILIVPKLHIASMEAVTADNNSVIGHIFSVIPRIAKQLGLESGYRLISNCGHDGGQTVMHLHFHLLGGKALGNEIL